MYYESRKVRCRAFVFGLAIFSTLMPAGCQVSWATKEPEGIGGCRIGVGEVQYFPAAAEDTIEKERIEEKQ